jgi:hypothetical protein
VLYLNPDRTISSLAAQAEWQTRLLPAATDQMAPEATRCRHRNSPASYHAARHRPDPATRPRATEPAWHSSVSVRIARSANVLPDAAKEVERRRSLANAQNQARASLKPKLTTVLAASLDSPFNSAKKTKPGDSRSQSDSPPRPVIDKPKRTPSP